jgi:hypothetical protein
MRLEKVELAESFFKKALGLMFRKNLEGALVLTLPRETRVGASIHTFFMRFPIDVLFLDEERRVVDTAFNVRPWTFNVTPRSPVRYVVEFEAGNMKKPGIGEKIEWKT